MANEKLIVKNGERWAHAKFKPAALQSAASVAKRLVAAKDRYVGLSGKTGVPWFVIAVIHEREAGQRWDRSIAQGDPWVRVSTHVPKGRGPFNSWEDAGVDALVHCAPYAAKWSDWTAAGTMTLLELYNGLGYAKKGRPSPYIWSGTDQYVSGKYVADGVYDPNVVDSQLGCAVLIDEMKILDPTISFTDTVTPPPAETTITAHPPVTEAEAEAINAPKAGPVGKADGSKPLVKSKTLWASLAGVAATAGQYLTDWHILAVVVVVIVFGYIIWERNGKPDIRGWIK